MRRPQTASSCDGNHLYPLLRGKITRWQDGSTDLRWAAAAILQAEKHYRWIMGSEQLWVLEAHLNERLERTTIDGEQKAG